MVLRAVVLLFILAVSVYCWLRVFSKSLRRRTRPWWWTRSKMEDDERLTDAYDLFVTLIGAFITSALFIYIAGLGYWWK